MWAMHLTGPMGPFPEPCAQHTPCSSTSTQGRSGPAGLSAFPHQVPRCESWQMVISLPTDTWSYTGSSLALETGRTGSPRCKGEGRIPNRRLTVLAPDGTGREAPLCAAGWFALLTSCYLCNWSSRRRCLIKPIQALIQSFFQPPSPAGRQPWRHEPDGGGRACPQAPLCGGCTLRQEAPVTQAPCPLASGSAGTGWLRRDTEPADSSVHLPPLSITARAQQTRPPLQGSVRNPSRAAC